MEDRILNLPYRVGTWKAPDTVTRITEADKDCIATTGMAYIVAAVLRKATTTAEEEMAKTAIVEHMGKDQFE